ncbi:hypothetical protein BR93DRAFT_928034 [Coniochaeta sp. PMI_546]|nr:hypothetical protein BR93DRAFT_928034 [Coniochaeta sp. PMI_546]
MGRTKKASKKAGAKTTGRTTSRSLVNGAAGNHAKARHMRDRRGNLHVWDGRLPTGLVAKPIVAQTKSKHRSYFEFVENTNKKKKLEFTVTQNREPPPGYEFVPIGNPALTAACKELSREQEAMIFIVSTYSSGNDVPDLTVALNRVGHHIRERIVEQARASLGEMEDISQQARLDVPEPIPEDQEEINKQADAAIRDLFPRIPNTDRQIIIEHSFRKGAKAADGMPLVGLAADLTLSRRVQLAVISHIRHTHTRYDQLLRETTWANARRAVEELCLDILVKWRGDEENGRDQLDEILREVVVISDSEDDYEDEEDEDDDDDADAEDTEMTSGESSDETAASTGERPPLGQRHASASASRPPPHPAAATARQPSVQQHAETELVKAAAKRAHRGFQRYQAVRDQAWQQALNRQRQEHDQAPFGSMPPTMTRPQSHTLERPWELGTHYPPYGGDRDDGAGPSDYHARRGPHANAVHPSGAQRDDRMSHAYRVNPDHLTAHGSQQTAYYHEKDKGQGNGDGDENGYRPIVGSRSAFRSSPGLRTVVSRPAPEDLKDYLVPSIEPTSPLASQFSAQTLEDRRQDQRSEHWQSRPALQHGKTEPQYASSQLADEGFIRVYRQAGDRGRAEPMPYAYAPTGASRSRNSDIRPEVQEPVSHRPVTMANASSHQEYPAPFPHNNYMPANATYSRQADARVSLDQTHRVTYEPAEKTRWQPAVPDHGSGARYRDATRPIVVEDERTWREPYGPCAAPVRDDGSSARYRDASRPIVVEDDQTWGASYRSYPAPARVGEGPEAVLVRRPVPGERGEYINHRIPKLEDSHPQAPEADRRLPLDFIPVSNMFPRPHGHQIRRVEPQAYTSAAYPRGAIMDGPPQGSAGNGYDQRYIRDTPDSRNSLPRQERVVRYEFVNNERMNEKQLQRSGDQESTNRTQDPLAGVIALGAAYGTPPAPRPSRQDGVIYLE